MKAFYRRSPGAAAGSHVTVVVVIAVSGRARHVQPQARTDAERGLGVGGQGAQEKGG